VDYWETEALLDAFEYNYLKSERPNHGKKQWEYCAEEVNKRPGRPKNALLRDAKQCKTKMDSLCEQYKTFKSKELKSGSGSVVWPSYLQQLDKILGTHPKLKGLEGSRDVGKKVSQLANWA